MILGCQSASRLHQPARPHRGLSTDPAAIGQEPGGTAHPCVAETAEERPHPSGDRAGPRGLDSLRAYLSAASGARRNGRDAGRSMRRVTMRFQRMIAVCGDPEILSDQTARGRCDAVRRTAVRNGCRPPWPRQHPHCAAADEGRRTGVGGADGLAGQFRSRQSRKTPMTTPPFTMMADSLDNGHFSAENRAPIDPIHGNTAETPPDGMRRGSRGR